MTMMVTERAAAALANDDNRFNKVETDLAVLKWMVGLVIAGVIALVLKAFF